jgi:hypothetical protein
MEQSDENRNNADADEERYADHPDISPLTGWIAQCSLYPEIKTA